MEKQIVFQSHHLTKTYKQFKALDEVSMTIYEGDIYGFVGENGAGKTTLIRLACSLSLPTSGEYSLFGVSSKDKEIYNEKRKISAIVESVSINKNLNALCNLKVQCMIAGIKRSDDELNQILEDVGLDLESIKNKKAASFSLGMRQRLGLAIALISEPKFVLLDEPMNGLDPQGFVDMRETILRLNKKGVTFLISSHILSELEKICTRVGFLSRGRLLTELSIEELHRKARRKIVIRVNEASKINGELIKTLNIKESEVQGDFITIYDLVDVNDVMSYLVKNNINILSISTSEDTIEDYYRKIMSVEVVL